MKKILFILTNLAGGGAEKVLIDIFRHTDFECFKVDLLLVVNEGIYLSSLPSQIRVMSLYEKRGIRYKLDFLFTRYLRIDIFQCSLVKKKIGEDYDVIVSFMEGIPLRFHKYLMDRAKKNVSWVHLDLLKHHYTKRYFRKNEELWLYQAMDQVFFVSNEARQSFSSLFGSFGSFITIYNPIDREMIEIRAKEKNVEKKNFTICSVGRLTYQKRYDRLLILANRLKKSGLKIDFWLLGIGPLEENLKHQVRQLGIEDCINFLGFQSNPYPYIKAADMFLSTSMTEGYPLVICEALCLDKPIVATNVTGPREILGDSEYGLLTNESDEAIFSAVQRMIDDEDLRKHYATKASERKQLFDIQSTVDNIYRLISSDSND